MYLRNRRQDQNTQGLPNQSFIRAVSFLFVNLLLPLGKETHSILYGVDTIPDQSQDDEHHNHDDRDRDVALDHLDLGLWGRDLCNIASVRVVLERRAGAAMKMSRASSGSGCAFVSQVGVLGGSGSVWPEG